MGEKASRLIERVRSLAGEPDASDTEGISDEDILRMLNNAQDRIQSLITGVNAHAFVTTTTIALVAGTREYTLPADVQAGSKVISVECKADSDDQNYYFLNRGTAHELIPVKINYPSKYVIRGKSLIVSPVPETGTGTLRVTYIRRFEALDKRRGLISAVSTSGSYYDTITLANDSNLSATELAALQYITVVDAYGTVNYYAIPVTSYNSSTRVLQLDTSSVPTSGGTISVDDYVVSGKFATTHSQLPDTCERYLIEYAVWKVLRKNSSEDALEQKEELAIIEEDIVQIYQPQDAGIERPSITDKFFT